MTTARRQQICLGITPFYHCVTRCVRRAYLCGYDRVGKRNLDHRRQWIEDRLVLFAEVFCIDIAGFTVMSNHYHVVLRVDREKADVLSDDEVLDRWLRLYRGTDAVRRCRAGGELGAPELKRKRSIQHRLRSMTPSGNQDIIRALGRPRIARRFALA